MSTASEAMDLSKLAQPDIPIVIRARGTKILIRFIGLVLRRFCRAPLTQGSVMQTRIRTVALTLRCFRPLSG